MTFFFYPREVSVSFPLLELQNLLKLDNGNGMSYDILSNMLTVTTLWPLAITNDNYIAVYADLNSVDLYYPGVDELDGVHIARAISDEFIMPARSKEVVNWIEIDAHVTPSFSDGIRMNKQFTNDCLDPCMFILPKDCLATTTIFADIVLHLDDEKFSRRLTKAVGGVELQVSVELSCTIFFPKGDDE